MQRILVQLHRWIGIVLCLMFAAWFASGIVMIYVPFPLLPLADRIDRAELVDIERVRVAPMEAINLAGSSSSAGIRLRSQDGRPQYVIADDGRVVVVHADTGELAAALESSGAGRIAREFSGLAAQSVHGPVQYDQWVVYGAFDALRPYYRVRLDDPAGTDLYVSAITGEVVQRTSRSQRRWNYVGAVVHWIYPSVIRKHWALWDQLVWWVSLAGVVLALAGIYLGVLRWRTAARSGQRGLSSPYQGWMKWHHVGGLTIGVLVLTWVFSGWLSMDHGRLFSTPSPTPDHVERFTRMSVRTAADMIPVDALADAAPFSHAEIGAFAGSPVLRTAGPNGPKLWRLLDNRLQEFRPTTAEVSAAVANAWPDYEPVDSYVLGKDDVYTSLRGGSLPPGTVRIVLNDPADTWVHVHPTRAEIVSIMDRSRRVYRWLFNGLHSFDFPGLVDRRPLWDALMIALLSCGFIFCVTAIVIGFRRIKQTTR